MTKTSQCRKRSWPSWCRSTFTTVPILSFTSPRCGAKTSDIVQGLILPCMSLVSRLQTKPWHIKLHHVAGNVLPVHANNMAMRPSWKATGIQLQSGNPRLFGGVTGSWCESEEGQWATLTGRSSFDLASTGGQLSSSRIVSSPLSYWAALLLFVAIACSGYRPPRSCPPGPVQSTSRPRTINVDQLWVIRSRMTTQYIFDPDGDRSPTWWHPPVSTKYTSWQIVPMASSWWHIALSSASVALWIVVHWSCENISVLVNILMDTGLTLTCHMADLPYGSHWRQYLPCWRSGSPYGLLLATSPTASTRPFSGHDPSTNGSSAVPLPLPTTTICFILSSRRTSCTRPRGRVSSPRLQTVLVEVGPSDGSHQRECGCACSCWASGFIEASWSRSRKNGAIGRLLRAKLQRLLHSIGHSSFQQEPGSSTEIAHHWMRRWFSTRMWPTLKPRCWMDEYCWSVSWGWRAGMWEHGRGSLGCQNTGLFGGVVWWPQANAW